jgi:hypothetical protein
MAKTGTQISSDTCVSSTLSLEAERMKEKGMAREK